MNAHFSTKPPSPSGRGFSFPAFFVVLLSAAFRLNGLAWVRHNYDRAYPHGLGIIIRDAVIAGHLDQLPKVSLLASINFPNPAGASYFYALLSAIEPSAYVTTALNALLGTLVAAITFNMTRRMFGSTWAATTAGVLAAVSPWAAWVGRGAWLQGPIEPMAALTFWLLFNTITARKPRHLAAAFVWVALCMQTYLVAFGLLAQLAVVLAVGALGALRPLKPMRRAMVVGLAACAISLAAYAGAAISSRASLSSVVNNPNAVNTKTRAGEINLDPISHALRIASGRDYENTFVETDTPNYALRNDLSDARATVVDGLLVIGLVICAWQAIRGTSASVSGLRNGGFSRLSQSANPTGRLRTASIPATQRQASVSPPGLLLAWFLLPIVGTLIIANLVMRDWEVHVFYLLLTSPAPYVLAGVPFAWLARKTSNVKRKGSLFTFHVLRFTLLLPAIAIPIWNVQGDIDGVRRYPYDSDGMTSLPLGAQIKLAQVFRANGCTTLDDDQAEWQASLLGTSRQVQAGNFRAKNGATIWQMQANGGACSMLVDAPPAPANAALTTIMLPGEKHTDHQPVDVHVYRALPITHTQPLLTTNLGWSLLDLQTPTAIRAGQSITVTHIWRVDELPNEDYLHWYFAPFVKLIAPDGRTIADVNGAPAIEGYRWLRGWLMVSTIHINLPTDLAPGDYTLEFSLFDPNQKKNAVYFDPVAPDKPIVTIQRRVTIQ